MAGLNRSRGLDFLLSGNKIKEQAETEVKAATTVQESNTTILPVNDNSVVLLPIEKLKASVYQPRKAFNEESLNELASSIKEHGLLEPLLVKKSQDEMYEIICGERRFRACKIAQLASVPCLIRDDLELNGYAVALIENIQREDLNPIEEAFAYKRLLEEFNLKQDEVAERVSKSRTAVTNSIRLLKLNEKVQQMVIDDMIQTGHARALLGIEDLEKQYNMAQKVFDEKLSVRETEKLVKKVQKEKEEVEKTKMDKQLEIVYQDLEEKMKQILGTKVSINAKDENKGKIEIEYYNKEDLDRLIDMILK